MDPEIKVLTLFSLLNMESPKVQKVSHWLSKFNTSPKRVTFSRQIEPSNGLYTAVPRCNRKSPEGEHFKSTMPGKFPPSKPSCRFFSCLQQGVFGARCLFLPKYLGQFLKVGFKLDIHD